MAKRKKIGASDIDDDVTVAIIATMAGAEHTPVHWVSQLYPEFPRRAVGAVVDRCVARGYLRKLSPVLVLPTHEGAKLVIQHVLDEEEAARAEAERQQRIAVLTEGI